MTTITKEMDREEAAVELEGALGLEEGNHVENDGWETICDALRGMVSADAYQRWFRASRWLGAEGG